MSQNETYMLQGSRTWLGILLTVLGLLGWGDLVSSDQVAELTNGITQLVGIALAVFGNYKAHREIKSLGGYR